MIKTEGRWTRDYRIYNNQTTLSIISPAFQAFLWHLGCESHWGIEPIPLFFFGKKLSSFLGDDQDLPSMCKKEMKQQAWHSSPDFLAVYLMSCCMLQGIYSAVYCLVALNCMVSLQNNPRGLRTLQIPWIDRSWDTKWRISQANQLGAPLFYPIFYGSAYAVRTTSMERTSLCFFVFFCFWLDYSGIWICNEIPFNEHSHELKGGHLLVNFRGHPQLSHGNMKEVALNCGDTRNFLISAENYVQK